MSILGWNRNVLVLSATALALLLVGNIKIEPPSDLQGKLVTEGRIIECDFGRIRGSSFFLGLKLDIPEAPYLRLNAKNRSRGRYEDMCRRLPRVRVDYHAVKRVVGPVRFWVSRIQEA